MHWWWSCYALLFVMFSTFSLLMEGRVPVAATPLTASVSASATTFSVSSAANFAATGSRGFVGEEEFSWTGKTSTTLTGITRGINGTEAVSHPSGQRVQGETVGLISQALDYKIINARAIPLLGNSAAGDALDVISSPLNKAGAIIRFMGKLVAMDYNWLDGDMGFVKLLFYAVGIGLVTVTILNLRRS